jgi:hypothetical protein
MSKRGRDDAATAAAGAVDAAPAAASRERQIKSYKLRVELNQSFLRSLEDKIRRNPSCVLEMEANDYVKYSKQIRVRSLPLSPAAPNAKCQNQEPLF